MGFTLHCDLNMHLNTELIRPKRFVESIFVQQLFMKHYNHAYRDGANFKIVSICGTLLDVSDQIRIYVYKESPSMDQ